MPYSWLPVTRTWLARSNCPTAIRRCWGVNSGNERGAKSTMISTRAVGPGKSLNRRIHTIKKQCSPQEFTGRGPSCGELGVNLSHAIGEVACGEVAHGA